MSSDWPEVGSEDERVVWKQQQQRLGSLFQKFSQDPRLPQTVVVIPSLSLDPRELSKLTGVYHYEERMLVNLMLLKQPRTRLVYVTSQRLDPTVVEYYLSLLPGVPSSHARKA